MNQACARNDTIDAGNHHGRPQYRQQYRPFLQFLTTQEATSFGCCWPSRDAEVRHPPQRRVHEHHRIIGRARHFGCDRHCVRHQTHSMAYAIADSHRFLLVLLRRGRGAMAIHPSAYQPLTDYFAHLMYRQYINESSVWGGGRPQFLFAEPSYIGMHLFGVLLPLMWLMRGRDRIYAKLVAQLIVVVCDCAVLMQAGTRIVLRANLPES